MPLVWLDEYDIESILGHMDDSRHMRDGDDGLAERLEASSEPDVTLLENAKKVAESYRDSAGLPVNDQQGLARLLHDFAAAIIASRAEKP